MSGQDDTLGLNNPQSGDPPPAPPETPPGQQTGGEGQGGTQTTPPQTGTAPGQQAGQDGGDGDTVKITLSKEKFDDRMEQAGRSEVRSKLESLGFEGLDDPDKITQALADIKDLIDLARQTQRDKLTAEQKVQADLKAATDSALAEKTKRETAEKERDLAQQHLRDFILRSSISNAAQGAAHPSDVYDLYARVYAQDKLAEVIKADTPLFAEDGTFNAEAINADAVKAIIDKCKEERKEWWQGARYTPGSPSNAGAHPPGTDLNKLEKQKQMARDLLHDI